jgi:hypothetical protein
MNIDSWLAQILLGLGTNFAATLAGVLVALLIRDRVYYRRLYDGWKVRVTYDGEDLLPEGRTIGWSTAKEITGSTAEESVLLKGIASPYVWLNCDLITEGRKLGILTVHDKPKRGFGKSRTYVIDFRPGEVAGALTINRFAQAAIDEIKVRKGLDTPTAGAAATPATKPDRPPFAEGLIIVNFAHPLTAEQLAAVEQQTGQTVAGIRNEPTQTAVDPTQPLAPQVAAVVDGIGLSAAEWQGQPILVVPPGYAPATSTLMAELHGRMGHFPSVIRIAPVPGSTPVRYDVAEIIDLQSLVRDPARTRREG